jgi:hypothetical protein
MRKNQRRGSKRDPKNTRRKKKQTGKVSQQLKHGVCLARKLRLVIPDNFIFNSLRFHGNTKWQPSELFMLALLWGMSGSGFVTDAFTTASSACQSIFCSVPVATYQGMMFALVQWTDRFMEVLFKQLQLSMQTIGGAFYCVFGYVPIAFDGSRVTVPRTAANEEEFCAKNYGEGKYAKATKRKGTKVIRNEHGTAHPQEPQIWITMLWHMGLRLPWRWKLGRSDSSERKHVKEMLDSQKFPANSLFCGDAGFVGYHFWERIMTDGYDFMVRVGANARLLAESCNYLKQPDGNVLCWPNDVRSKGKPIRLRLVQVKVGTSDVWLLTSVLSEQKLSKAQMIAFYKMRWGIEIEFRGLKQTLDCAKMSCLKPSRSLVELNWSIAAMAVSELLAMREQIRVHSRKCNKSKSIWTPQRRSLAQTMRAIRIAINKPDIRPKFGNDLTTKLEQALTDTYKRGATKKARHQPRPNKQPLKPPIVNVLSSRERSKIEMLDKIAA